MQDECFHFACYFFKTVVIFYLFIIIIITIIIDIIIVTIIIITITFIIFIIINARILKIYNNLHLNALAIILDFRNRHG